MSTPATPIARSPSRRPSFAVMIVISSSLVALIVAAFVIDATGASTQRWKSVKKTTVVGFFAQDLAETNETTFDYVRVNSVQLRTYFLSFECFPGVDFWEDHEQLRTSG